MVNEQDLIEARDNLRYMSLRISSMNQNIIEAYHNLDEKIDNNEEVNEQTLRRIRGKISNYDSQKDLLDDKVLRIEQLINP